MYLLFDIGGTNIRITVSDGKTVNEPRIVPTPLDFQEGIETIKKIADELSNGQKIKQVAGGIAVVFNEDKSIPISTSHLHGWVNKPLKDSLEKQFQVPVTLENDTAVYGLGEATVRKEARKNIVVYLTISTGVGGVRIVNQKIDKNALGFEPGHQIIVIDGNSCHCGGKGHLETYVGGWYLERDYHLKAENIKDPQIWDKVAKYLAVGLNNTIVHWSPDILILGGAVMKSISLEKVKSYLSEKLTIFPTPPKLILAQLGDKGGLYGALALLNR